MASPVARADRRGTYRSRKTDEPIEVGLALTRPQDGLQGQTLETVTPDRTDAVATTERPTLKWGARDLGITDRRFDSPAVAGRRDLYRHAWARGAPTSRRSARVVGIAYRLRRGDVCGDRNPSLRKSKCHER